MAKYQYTMEINVSENNTKYIKEKLDYLISDLFDNISFISGQTEELIKSELKEIK